ncbi:MAG: RNA polymerase sigma-70 factor [Reichenbachiella sp.]|uniref:RNA polymerase sigma-70 factor n=1 Tax=Reichenbachiella sp. TaxID=2184521 RepID=UPI003266A45E
MTAISEQDTLDQKFKALYFKYYSVALRTAIYILKSEEPAEDVAQNVFLKLWDRREQIEELKNPKAYIVQMARNGALDALKKDDTLGEEFLPLEYAEDLGNEGPPNQDMRTAIEKAVADLSPKCRLVFSLSRFEGLTNPEIAEHLDISIRTVETQISNALKLLRTDLRHYFVEFLGWGILVGYHFFQLTTEFIS